jgi:HEAT repeat protein
MPSGRGLTAVRELARHHSNPDVQREAVETLGEHLAPAEAVTVLEAIATGDAHADVQREAVEALGELETEAALSVITRIARTHANDEVRREAIETYAEHAPRDAAVKLLTEILGTDTSEDIYDEVLESLEELESGAGIPALMDAARAHPNREVRTRALRRLAESDDPRAQEIFERALRRP